MTRAEDVEDLPRGPSLVPARSAFTNTPPHSRLAQPVRSEYLRACYWLSRRRRWEPIFLSSRS